MRAVRDDPTVPLITRLDAAERLGKAELQLSSIRTPTVAIHIQSIIPGQQDTIELYHDLLYMKWCYEHGELNPSDPANYRRWNQETGYGDPNNILFLMEAGGHA
jgi:hypothetical protein